MYVNKNDQAAISNQQTISSVEIAKISGKNHKELLRSIRSQEVAWEKINGRKFALVNYTDAKGEKRPMYDFSQKESLYIISKFNDYVRAKIIKRWMQLELDAIQVNIQPEAQIRHLIADVNEKRELPVVDLPMEIEVYRSKHMRTFTHKGIKLTVLVDLINAYDLGSRAYKVARKINKGTMKAVKIIDIDGQVLWAVDALGRKIAEGNLQWHAIKRGNQLSMSL